MKIIISAILFIVFLAACESEDSRIQRYTDIYYDIMVAKETYLDSALAAGAIDSIMKHYGYDISTFEKESYELFMKDRKNFTTIIDSVRKRAEAEMRAILSEKEKARDTTTVKE